ncbi:DEAD/DEAH box helicase family protein [Tyzzerella sp. OttesenSCG-928-J15]|nr:DEAD/DEAH box helicase family protein [Tyzzerella sp. OttesenSCG-928-J15]
MRVKEKPKLLKITYTDVDIKLEAYADTLVYDTVGDNKVLTLIRFAGYPEHVKGLSDAIYGGISFDVFVTSPDNEDQFFAKLVSSGKRYIRDIQGGELYAEACLTLRDTANEMVSTNVKRVIGGKVKSKKELKETKKRIEGENSNIVASAAYIYCEKGNIDALYNAVDQKTSVPLVQEFRDYFIYELKQRNLLRLLPAYSWRENLEAWKVDMSDGENPLYQVINDGLKSGAIHIPGSEINAQPFPETTGVSSYLKNFGPMLADRIKDQFSPLYDPQKELLSLPTIQANEAVKQQAGYNLYDAQLSAVEAVKRSLELNDTAIVVGECGVGKTKIGSVVLKAYELSKGMTKSFNVVVCPSHMTKKWVREILETIDNADAVKLDSIEMLEKLYTHYEKGTKSLYVIMSKEKARDGYMRRPSAIYRKTCNDFICPHCMKTLMMDFINEHGSSYRVEADQTFFMRENKKNHKCDHCGSVLWTALNPDAPSKWVKIANYGFVHRDIAQQHFLLTKNQKVHSKISEILGNKDYKTRGAYRRFSIASYMKEKMRGRIDFVILDELHQFAQDSGQGDAAGELVCVAKKAIGLTGTLFNGYSKGIYHLLWRMCPEKMIEDNKRFESSDVFNKEYGVTETVYEVEAEYNSNRRSQKRKIKERQLPGISPLVYARFLIEKAVFISLMDMGKDLPEYEEIPIGLQMNKQVAEEYRRIETKVKNIFQYEKKIAKKVMSACLNLLTTYPDQPYDQKIIYDPISKVKEVLIRPKDTSNVDELHEKDRKILELVAKKIQNGEKVCIYTNWVGIDSQEKIYNYLTDASYRVEILKSTVPPEKREDWLEEKSQKGIDVLITNPALVETGLDLLDYTTLIFYDIGYNLFTLRQAARRSWRLNQKKPRVEVYFFYYKDTMQQRAVKLMATKVAVAGVLEGQISDEGLAAMSECQDMTTIMAQELTSGIKEEVEDLGSIFKRMAFLKTDDNADKQVSLLELSKMHYGFMEEKEIAKILPEIQPIDIPILASFIDNNSPPQTSIHIPLPKVQIQALPMQKPTAKPIKKKPVKNTAFENQISIFDLLTKTA